jgi:dTDP-4-dehydrorhamnose reductase
MHILVTGANGRLGSALARALEGQGVRVTAIDIDRLDLTDFPRVRTFLRELRPDWVAHPAAWTDVDGCAREPERALLHNGIAAGYVAQAAAEAGAGVLYISSNEVFDGAADHPYLEYDAPRPVNSYGMSKWAGEQAVARLNPRHMIVRIAWLFAHGGRNFVHAILRAAAEGKPLRVVTDEVANPTYAEDLAPALAALLADGRCGVFHLTNAGWCSRYAFARCVLDVAGYGATPIAHITSAEWPRPSAPPLFTPLANVAASAAGIALRPWEQAVEAFVRAEGLAR